MDKKLEKSLIDALSWASLRELPEKDKGEDVYILALALVSKKDGSKAYVATKKTKDGTDKIVKDFGSTAMIVKVEEVYPYLLLDASYIPQFNDKKKEERIKWLTLTDTEGGNYEDMSLKELNKAILNRAIQCHLKAINNE